MQDFINKLLEQPACVIVDVDKINGLIEKLNALGFKVNGEIWLNPNDTAYLYLPGNQKIKFLSFSEIAAGLGKKHVYKLADDGETLI